MDDSVAGCSNQCTGINYINAGKSILRAGHQYYLKRTYKNGSEIWECCNRRRQKCTGSIVVRENVLITEKPHQCKPDFDRNKVTLLMQDIKTEITSTEVPSIPATFDKHKASLRFKSSNSNIIRSLHMKLAFFVMATLITNFSSLVRNSKFKFVQLFTHVFVLR